MRSSSTSDPRRARRARSALRFPPTAFESRGREPGQSAGGSLERPPGTARPIEILILRDPRESARKCSLTPLRGLERIRFASYDPARRLDAGGRILLHPEGRLLTPADAGRDLLLVDCSWRRVDRLLSTVAGELVPRRLPALRTAYPRASKQFADPAAGLASVEALYAALWILGERRPELLASYRWREQFLAANPQLAG
jgi:pre-rRNA-processing protein TSR3